MVRLAMPPLCRPAGEGARNGTRSERGPACSGQVAEKPPSTKMSCPVT